MLISLTKVITLFQEEYRAFSLSYSLSLLTFLPPAVCLVTQLCPTLCDPLDCSPPASSAHGVFQAKILEWVSISSSRKSSWPRDWTHVSSVPSIAGGFFSHQVTFSIHQGSHKPFEKKTDCHGSEIAILAIPFRYNLNQIPYDYTVEVRNRFKGLDMIECLMNFGRRFMTLYRRQGSRPSPWKRNPKRQNGCLRRPYR